MYPVLGKPLLYWTLKSSLESKSISQTWVTSDDVEILDFAKQNGANIIKRPQSLSKDFVLESAWFTQFNIFLRMALILLK